jgi:hypothetical protein
VLRGVTDRTVHLKGNSCIRKATESGENRQLLWPPAVREVHNASWSCATPPRTRTTLLREPVSMPSAARPHVSATNQKTEKWRTRRAQPIGCTRPS